MQKWKGFVILLGGALFIAGALHPAIQRYWFATYAAVPAEFKAGWLAGYRLFAAGAFTTAIGFALLGGDVRRRSGAGLIRGVSITADALLLTGAVCWVRSLNEHVFPPIHVLIPNSVSLPWFSLFVNFTLLSFLLYGFALLRAGDVRWLGWGTLGVNALIVVALLITGDLPPAVYYLWPVVLGIGLLVRRETGDRG